MRVGEMLADEYIALAPSLVDRYLEIYYRHVRIAYIDTKHTRVIARLPKNALKEKS